MTRGEKKRLWSITIDKIRFCKTMAVVEWKDGRKTKHFLANVVMYGGDEGPSPIHLTTNYPMYKEIKEIEEIINT